MQLPYYMIVTIAIQTFSKWIVVLEYEINKDYIAKNLCVNRAMPARCCKGKCFLQKKLAEEDGQQQSSGKSAQREDGQVQFFLNKISKIEFSLPAFIHQHNSYLPKR